MVIPEFKEYWENSVNIFKKYNQNYTFGTKKVLELKTNNVLLFGDSSN